MNLNRPKYLAVDFDDTLCCRKSWGGTLVGDPHLRIVELVRALRSKGWKVILWTCRNGVALDDAVAWCKSNDIPIDFVNENPEAIVWFRETCGISHAGWSPKIFADLYLDDSALSPFRLLDTAEFVEDHDMQEHHVGIVADAIDRMVDARLEKKMKRQEERKARSDA